MRKNHSIHNQMRTNRSWSLPTLLENTGIPCAQVVNLNVSLRGPAPFESCRCHFNTWKRGVSHSSDPATLKTPPQTFNCQRLPTQRPAELQQAFGYLCIRACASTQKGHSVRQFVKGVTNSGQKSQPSPTNTQHTTHLKNPPEPQLVLGKLLRRCLHKGVRV